jgi:hypothetical protein
MRKNTGGNQDICPQEVSVMFQADSPEDMYRGLMGMSFSDLRTRDEVVYSQGLAENNGSVVRRGCEVVL